MPQVLGNILATLGLSQYLDTFTAQGFDSWDTVLDITEADLDILGVKLGHRRKLQRQIALARGFSPNAALPTSGHNDGQDSAVDTGKAAVSREECYSDGAVTKRKYRRHPKPDKDAPERPPSAYVLFSNKTREELKGQCLSFTEIAKIVGENWQRISHEEREQFERRAQEAKDKYRRELAEYKKRPEHQKYAQYLQDFKAAEQARRKGTSKSSRSGTNRIQRSSTSSGIDGSNGARRLSLYRKASPTTPAWRQKRGSVSTWSESQPRSAHPSEPPPSPPPNSVDVPFDNAPVTAPAGSRRHQKLPSLSDVLDGRLANERLCASPNMISFEHNALPGMSGVSGEQSSPAGSPMSCGSSYGAPCPARDVALSIQSLLSGSVARSGYVPASPLEDRAALACGRFQQPA